MDLFGVDAGITTTPCILNIVQSYLLHRAQLNHNNFINTILFFANTMKLNHRLFTTRTGQFILFKYTIYTLLAINIYLFSINGTFTETIDTAAWMVILALFEWETISLKEEYSGMLEKIAIALLITRMHLASTAHKHLAS
jgi:hypothetical protein